MGYIQSRLPIEGGRLFYRCTEIDSGRPTILFLHGLGDSGRVFLGAFNEASLRDYNIVVPDLLGYGQSRLEAGKTSQYRFESQIACLDKLIHHLGVTGFSLVGHSMGGNIGSLMCTADEGRCIRAFVNIEGDLTQGDRFMTDRAMRARRKGKAYFEVWLRDELIDILFQGWSARFSRTRKHYQKSLRSCSADAFWANVKQIRSLNANIPGQNFAWAALLFKDIRIPKVFYWGSKTLSSDSVNYLHRPALRSQHKMFEDTSHWIMLDQSESFYESLVQFLMRWSKNAK